MKAAIGHAKERFDVSTRSYVQDLDFGRQAAAWPGWTLEEGLAYLPHLWRYTLLRGSIRSRADQYSLKLFQLMLILGQESEALGLAELLTNPLFKVQVLLQVAQHMGRMPTRMAESTQLFFRAQQVASLIEQDDERARALRELASAFAQAQQWEQAYEVASSIEQDNEKARALYVLASAFAQAQQWEQAQAMFEQAREVASSIEQDNEKAGALRELVKALLVISEYGFVLHITQDAWCQAETRATALYLFPLACELISFNPEVGRGLAEAFRWVDSFLRHGSNQEKSV